MASNNPTSDEEMASNNSNQDDEDEEQHSDIGPDPELIYKFHWIYAQISSFLDVYISQQ